MHGRTSETPHDPDDPAGRTLGDLLYAHVARSRASEADWVALVRSTAAGDERALQALYERTHRLVFTLCVRITRSRETAEEVTLDVFHDVWRRASHYDPAGGSVVGWIMNQARSRAIDRLRFEQRRKRALPGAQTQPTAIAEEPADEDPDLREDDLSLRNALRVLTETERQAIETAFFSELTYSQTAARLNEPVGTIKTRIRSGLRKLRQAMHERSEKP